MQISASKRMSESIEHALAFEFVRVVEETAIEAARTRCGDAAAARASGDRRPAAARRPRG